MILKTLAFLLPWPLRRRALQRWFKYDIHPTAYIGLAWIYPKKLIMGEGSKIDHFTVAIHLDRIELQKKAKIGRSNWISGFPTNTNSPHFKHHTERRSELILGESAAVTKNHHLDCTDLIHIGRFTTVAGYNSQFLTHSIDVMESRQGAAPIIIGEYAFVGTNVVILGGAVLPARTVLGAKSLLNKKHTKEWMLYGGVPAKEIKSISSNAKYFTRPEGFVY